MSHRLIMMKKMILLTMILLMISNAGAAICTVMGYAGLEDGSPAPSGIIITVSDTNKSISYDTYTGGKDWPVKNFYVQTLSCDFYDEIIIENKATGFKKTIIFDHYPYEVNITLPYAVVQRHVEPKIEKPISIRQEDRYMHDVMEPDMQKETKAWYLYRWYPYITTILIFALVIISYKLSIVHKR